MTTDNTYHSHAGQGVSAAPSAYPQQTMGDAYSQQAPSPAPPAPPASSAAAPAKKANWVPLIVILALVALIVFGVAACAKSMAGLGQTSNTFAKDTVAIISLDGTIQYDGSECSPEGFKTLLDEAEDDDHVKAVVLRVNSGGGTATAGEEMTEYLRRFSKPVVVSSASINASAAYEISSQADYIYTAKTTEIGSIGTVMQVTDLSGLMEKLGIDVDSIASADSKDSSYGMRPLTDEERAYYQDMIDEINGVFIENVAEGRSMTTEEVTKLATGLTWTGVTAVENGIADEIGTLDDACQKAAELGGCAEDYETSDLSLGSSEIYDLLGLLSAEEGQSVSADDIARALKELANDGATID